MTTAGIVYGITSLKDLKDRCVVDPDSGCWSWRGAVTGAGIPCASVPVGVLGNTKREVMPAYKLAWALAGKSLPPKGEALMRCTGCRDPLCISPDHRKKGTRALINRTASARGSYCSPLRDEKLWAARTKQAISPEKVRELEILLSNGATARAAAAAVGCHPDVAVKVRDGVHVHQRRTGASSIFTWRPARAHLQEAA